LIGTDNVSVIFWVELAGELSGVYQVAEHHRELAPFSVRRGRDDWCDLTLSRRDVRRGRWRHGRGSCRGSGRPTCPHQDSAVFIHGQLFGIDEVFFERFQQVVIELQAQFEDSVGQTLLPLEEIQGLGHDGIVVHYCPFTCASVASV
jgi:hypothetical protein